METFITWAIIAEYVSFVGIVFMVVEFTKELKFIKPIPTKYWAFIVAFCLLLILNIHNGSFAWFDIVLYVLSSITVSLSSNGLYDFNSKNKKV